MTSKHPRAEFPSSRRSWSQSERTLRSLRSCLRHSPPSWTRSGRKSSCFSRPLLRRARLPRRRALTRRRTGRKRRRKRSAAAEAQARALLPRGGSRQSPQGRRRQTAAPARRRTKRAIAAQVLSRRKRRIEGAEAAGTAVLQTNPAVLAAEVAAAAAAIADRHIVVEREKAKATFRLRSASRLSWASASEETCVGIGIRRMTTRKRF
mmetsp:Transcript_55179/g.131491  ORF Transcript_55179/g.131491 Transcript_55179/m.131491 type:complete len:207 (+) Transcript_55179:254-874(+)